MSLNARGRRTRDALLQATRDLLEEQGFEALTMASVAERAGVSRRAIYLHFASRGDLIAALFDFVSESEGLSQSLQAVWESPDAEAALDAWARHVAGFHARVLAISSAVEHVRRSDSDASAHRDRYLREQLDACARVADWLQREGQLANQWTVETARDMIWGLLAVDLLQRLLIEQSWPEERLSRYISLLLKATFVRSHSFAEG